MLYCTILVTVVIIAVLLQEGTRRQDDLSPTNPSQQSPPVIIDLSSPKPQDTPIRDQVRVCGEYVCFEYVDYSYFLYVLSEPSP